MTHLLEDLCREVHDGIDAGKLLKDKQGDADLHPPHTQQLGCALLSLQCLTTCSSKQLFNIVKCQVTCCSMLYTWAPQSESVV